MCADVLSWIYFVQNTHCSVWGPCHLHWLSKHPSAIFFSSWCASLFVGLFLMIIRIKISQLQDLIYEIWTSKWSKNDFYWTERSTQVFWENRSFDDYHLILSVKDLLKVLPSYPVCLCVYMDVDPGCCPM